MFKSIATFIKNEEGATAIEYTLIAAATGLALIAVMPSIKGNLTTKFQALDAGLK